MAVEYPRIDSNEDLTPQELRDLRSGLHTKREQSGRRTYSDQLHWLKPQVYWAVPYDSDDDREVGPARPVVVQQEGQAVRIGLGGFIHGEKGDGVPDLHIELDRYGRWSVMIHPDQGDPAVCITFNPVRKSVDLETDYKVELEAGTHKKQAYICHG